MLEQREEKFARRGFRLLAAAVGADSTDGLAFAGDDDDDDGDDEGEEDSDTGACVCVRCVKVHVCNELRKPLWAFSFCATFTRAHTHTHTHSLPTSI